MYEYREVKCPWCGHIFMWEKHGTHAMESSFYVYLLKSTHEAVGEAVCPSCEIKMLVLEHVLEGIDPDDERFEKETIRGL